MKIIDTLKIGNYEKSIFENGLVVISEQVQNTASYSAGICVNIGARDDSISGIAHFMEHAVFRHTKKRNSKQIANEFETLGAYSNAFTTKEQTCFYVRAIKNHFAKTFELLCDIVLNAIFIEDEIEREKLVILEEIKSYEDDPEEYIFDLADIATFSNHNLANPIAGWQDSVKQIDYKELENFYKTFYRSENIVVCVVGDVDHKNVIKLVNKYFSEKELNHTLPINLRTKPTVNYVNKTVKKTIQQAHIVLGKQTQGLQSAEYYPLAVLNTLFGDGMSSRLYQNLREKHGLAYSIYSSINSYTDCGSWYIYAATDAKKYKRTIDLIYKEMQKLMLKMPTKKELNRAKEQLKTATIIEQESLSSRMQNLLKNEIVFGKYEQTVDIIQKIDQVTLDDIHTLSNKYFCENNWAIASIIPDNFF